MEQGALPLLPGPLDRSGWWHPGPLEYKCRDGEGEPWVLLQERALSPPAALSPPTLAFFGQYARVCKHRAQPSRALYILADRGGQKSVCEGVGADR